ncbi:NAD(P)/FAD-dependent oxidoreductase [Chryseobacterium salipaludis]|uniref:NAD(P)/FAD-dependent oxidoreductase n=1 Tax=Chryseobacterium TaxID=59732 RepID=UPI001FF15659|nr:MULTISPECIES: NAD(P)/FAD-dependent oxidoreductase [Chryseobacterium]MCJ8496812.1 NAD(P)/FAD-dependent oxidoreductase [Chryseobacterium salipaludis]MCX3296293.1 NAD(P)/FAD-dependent oxidoreductase [Planobacterium sp. JC490]
MDNKHSDIIIVGGGLAGLSAALHLLHEGFSVTVIEKSSYPKHKVCGEYISNEVRSYLQWLGLDLEKLQPAEITHLQFSSVSGKVLHTQLPLGGFGVSRYTLDDAMMKLVIALGGKIVQEQVNDIIFNDNLFTVRTDKNSELTAPVVLGAFGKRSNLDIKLERTFLKKRTPWLAVKAHYQGDFDDTLVGLHNFRGGYCGVSKLENGSINICYLAHFKTFKKHKNIEEYQREIVRQNPHLDKILSGATMIFEKPLTISQISFAPKTAVENHVLMMGDTAGLIHPLCGNGMAMAIHSAKLAAEGVTLFLHKKINRAQLENEYRKQWQKNFSGRLSIGRLLGKLLEHAKLAEIGTGLLMYFPFLLPIIIRKTHGKELMTTK